MAEPLAEVLPAALAQVRAGGRAHRRHGCACSRLPNQARAP